MRGRRQLSRDEVVTRGEEAREEALTHGGRPWIYTYKVKTGTRATLNIEQEHFNMKDLIAWAIVNHAISEMDFNIFGVKRQIRTVFGSNQEDV